MRLTKRKKLALGFATAWPIAYLLCFFVVVVFAIASMTLGLHAVGPTRDMDLIFMLVLPLHALTIFGSMALMVVYVVHAMQNPKLSQNDRQLWAIAIFLGSLIAMTIYYFMHVLPLADDADPAAHPPA